MFLLLVMLLLSVEMHATLSVQSKRSDLRGPHFENFAPRGADAEELLLKGPLEALHLAQRILHHGSTIEQRLISLSFFHNFAEKNIQAPMI